MPYLPPMYTHPADDIASTVTLPTGTIDPAFPLVNIFDPNPDVYAKFLGVGAIRLVYDSLVASAIGPIVLVNTNLDAGLNVRIQRNATNVWTSPSYDQALVIAASRGDGTRNNHFLYRTDFSTLYRYTSISIPAGNSVAPVIGRSWVSSVARSLLDGPLSPSQTHEGREYKESPTSTGSHTGHDEGVTTRQRSMDFRYNEAQLALLIEWQRACKFRTLSSIYIPNPAVNDAWLVKHSQALTVNYEDGEYRKTINTINVYLTEVGGIPA